MLIGVNGSLGRGENEIVTSLIRGFASIGADLIDIDDADNYPNCDIVICWGVPKIKNEWLIRNWQHKVFKTQYRRKQFVLTLDSGFIHRKKYDSYACFTEKEMSEQRSSPYYSLILNGLNNRGKYVSKNMPPDRWEKLQVQLKPWNLEGKRVLYCAQVPRDSAVQHIEKSTNLTLKEIDAYIFNLISAKSEKEVFFRPHPSNDISAMIPPENVSKNHHKKLEEDLNDNCGLVVCLNSNSAVEAVVNGIPALALDRGCMAWDVCGKTPDYIASPRPHDRDQWASNLAYSQWTEAEMASGEAVTHILSVIKDGGGHLSYLNGLASHVDTNPWEYILS
jgi:hypothetical protein